MDNESWFLNVIFSAISAIIAAGLVILGSQNGNILGIIGACVYFSNLILYLVVPVEREPGTKAALLEIVQAIFPAYAVVTVIAIVLALFTNGDNEW